MVLNQKGEWLVTRYNSMRHTSSSNSLVLANYQQKLALFATSAIHYAIHFE